MQIRSRKDRRRSGNNVRFPFRDSSGVLIPEDRRVQPERRLSGIEVEWLEMIHEGGMHKPY